MNLIPEAKRELERAKAKHDWSTLTSIEKVAKMLVEAGEAFQSVNKWAESERVFDLRLAPSTVEAQEEEINLHRENLRLELIQTVAMGMRLWEELGFGEVEDRRNMFAPASTIMHDAELKPCPFCGGTDLEKIGEFAVIFCKSCHTYGPISYAAWNVRAFDNPTYLVTGPITLKEGETVKECLESLVDKEIEKGKEFDRLVAEAAQTQPHAYMRNMEPAEGPDYGEIRKVAEEAIEKWFKDHYGSHPYNSTDIPAAHIVDDWVEDENHVTIEGVRYEAVGKNKTSCRGCFYEEVWKSLPESVLDCPVSVKAPCVGGDRADKRNVVWKRVG